jgi:hypothetical protein
MFLAESDELQNEKGHSLKEWPFLTYAVRLVVRT